ncbi:hypothetical protein ZIOFF_012821 [Zingiber officinale]|uniref:Pentatricopeptide repeat-containing protein n=1 Tax=Zingiber officinale TaxID=94328 RepID=A0A8J5HU25_ZINOF|nr:hypothetical protein ZIOFF_012821 [Zingiber officinale]
MLHIYGDTELFGEAIRLFHLMQHKDIEQNVVTNNTMIKIYGKTLEHEKAGNLFQEMQKKRIKPNAITYSTIISIWGKADKLDCPKTDIKKLKIEMEQLKAERNDIKSKIEEAKRLGRLASEETQQWQRDLKSLEGQVVAIFEDFTDFQNTIKVGPWGVAGDCKFDIGRSATQITKVTLHAGYIVDSMEISIVDGGNVETKRVGTSGGGGYHSVREVTNTLHA